ncbi:MAG: HAD-IA family hydrolase [Pseudomonadota bacterium]|nr:HAD-IA family hydrolase [Pseudomonadota bacterium]
MKSGNLSGATLVFDLDGTLVDTAPDLIGTLNHVLGGAGYGPRTLAEIRPFISFGARRMIEEGLRAHGTEKPRRDVDALLEAFLAHYGENVANESRTYPGVEAFLEQAKGAGARLAICTNKRADLSNQLIGALGLNRFFHAVAGRDTFPVCKPHPDHLTGAVQMARGNPARAIMIGDSETDIATAKAAGIPVVAVTFGYSETPVAAFGPDMQISHYDELDQAVSSLLSGL